MVRIIDITELKESIEAVLDKSTYGVDLGNIGNIMDRNVRICILPDNHLIARARYNESDYNSIIIEETLWRDSYMAGGTIEKHFELLEQHRPKLQEMANELELKAQHEKRRNIPVIYINCNG
jgi:hypothetical protein